jgi:hypothetical protein
MTITYASLIKIQDPPKKQDEEEVHASSFPKE